MPARDPVHPQETLLPLRRSAPDTCLVVPHSHWHIQSAPPRGWLPCLESTVHKPHLRPVMSINRGLFAMRDYTVTRLVCAKLFWRQ